MSRLTGVQAVSFDVGGTLIDPWPSVGHVYAAAARQAGAPDFDPPLLNARFAAAWRAKTGFDYSREAWSGLVARTFEGAGLGCGVDSPFFERLYDTFTRAEAWRIYPDVVPTLQSLKSRGLHLVVISNWDERLRPLLRNLGLDAYFDAIVVSRETGWHKPAPEIFVAAARLSGTPAAAMLHVGDSVAEDVEGAREAGLQALLLRREGAGGAEEISTLTALLEG